MWRAVVRRFPVACLLTGTLFVWPAAPVRGDDAVDVRKSTDRYKALIRRVLTIADLVLDHHIDSPTRQEMLLAGMKAAWTDLNVTPPADLSRRISDLKSPDDLGTQLEELRDKWAKSQTPSLFHDIPLIGPLLDRPQPEPLIQQLEAAFVNGMLSVVPGNARILPAKEARAETQIQANRYVGIGIALGLDQKEHLPSVAGVVPKGPAEKAGIKAGDLIEQIDETLTGELEQSAIIELIRGDEGTRVTMHVRQPKSDMRIVTIVRGAVILESVHGIEQDDAAHKGSRIDPALPIAYLRINRITASTADELRSWEPRLRAASIRALILDLRTESSNDPDAHHSAMLLADGLLERQPIGKLRTRAGVRDFESDRDCLFRDWPLAVLVDKNTAGAPEWVAAALQDFDRAVIVGAPTAGENFAKSTVPLPDGRGALILATGVAERTASDHPLAGPQDEADARSSFSSEPPIPGSSRKSSRWRVNPEIVVDNSGERGRQAVAAQQSGDKESQTLKAAVKALKQRLNAPAGPSK